MDIIEEVVTLKTNRSILDGARVVKHIHSEDGWSKDVLYQLNVMRLSGQMCDVIVNINGSNFECHRLVLAATCPYFQALFRHEPRTLVDPLLHLDTIPARGFHHVLEFMYTSELTITATNAVSILEAADFLQFRKIVRACADVLSQHINDNNALALDLLATAHSCWPLASSAHEHVLSHLKAVAQTKEFAALEPREMMAYVLASKCNCGIMDRNCSQCTTELSQIVQSWLRHSSDRSYDTILESLIAGDELNDNGNSFHNIARVLCVVNSFLKTLMVVPGDTLVKGTSIYYFNSLIERWMVLTALPFHGRSLYTSTNLDNNLYICGGKDVNNFTTNDVFIYVINNNRWEINVRPMLRRRCNHSAATCGGQLYVVGGREAEVGLWNEGEVYNPATHQWTLLPQMLDTTGIARSAIVPLGNRLYVFGGQEMMPSWRKGYAELQNFTGAQYFDVEEKRWVQSPELAARLRENKISIGHGDAFPWKGLILIIDEDLRGKKTKLFNPVTGKMIDYMRTNGQHRFGGYAILNETLYCTGGMVERMNTHDMIHYRHLVDEMDWQFMTPLPKCLSHHSCMVISKCIEPADCEVTSHLKQQRMKSVYDTFGLPYCGFQYDVNHSPAVSSSSYPVED